MPDTINFPYTSVQLTQTVNRIPNNYGLIRALGIFRSDSAVSTLVEVRRENGALRVLSAKERGGPADNSERKLGDAIYFEVPHFPLRDTIRPSDLQNMVTVMGKAGVRPRTMDDEMVKRLADIRMKHDITLEYQRMGALKGLIKDGEGTTLYNLYDAFGITQKTVDFVLGTDTTKVIDKCDEVIGHITDNLRGETMSQVEVLVDPTFFNRFVQHPKVEKYWLNSNNGTALAAAERVRLGGQWGRVFEFQNILFREYRGSAPVKSGDNVISEPFIATGKGHAYPEGTHDTFATHFAPADDIRHVNTPGEEVYISPEILAHGKGVDLLSESNPLALCRRPEVLVELYSSN